MWALKPEMLWEDSGVLYYKRETEMLKFLKEHLLFYLIVKAYQLELMLVQLIVLKGIMCSLSGNLYMRDGCILELSVLTGESDCI